MSKNKNTYTRRRKHNGSNYYQTQLSPLDSPTKLFIDNQWIVAVCVLLGPGLPLAVVPRRLRRRLLLLLLRVILPPAGRRPGHGPPRRNSCGHHDLGVGQAAAAGGHHCGDHHHLAAPARHPGLLGLVDGEGDHHGGRPRALLNCLFVVAAITTAQTGLLNNA